MEKLKRYGRRKLKSYDPNFFAALALETKAK